MQAYSNALCLSYQPKEEDLNLNMIKTLKDKFKCDVGYSGHEKSVNPSLYAAVAGARYIQRDTSLWIEHFGEQTNQRH